jgi:hypothetical protein
MFYPGTSAQRADNMPVLNIKGFKYFSKNYLKLLKPSLKMVRKHVQRHVPWRPGAYGPHL